MDDLLEALQFAEARLEELGEHELVGKCAAAFAKFKEKNTPKVVPQEPVLNLHDAAFARGFAAGKQYGQAQVDALVANVSRQMRDAAVKVCSEWKREETLDMCCDYAQNEALTKASEAIAALPIIGETK